LIHFIAPYFALRIFVLVNRRALGGERAYRLINSMKKDITSMMREKE
jgi:hypothetical protein